MCPSFSTSQRESRRPREATRLRQLTQQPDPVSWLSPMPFWGNKVLPVGPF